MKFKQCRRSWWTVRLKSTSVNNSSVCHTQALTLPQSSLPWTKPKWHLISLISQNYTPKTVNYLTRKGTWIRAAAVAAAAKSLQSCPTLCNSIDGSPPGFPIPEILQARTLEGVAISFSNAWKWKWSHSVVSDSERPHGLQPTRLLRPWDFPGKSTGVGCHCLLRIFSLATHDSIKA